MKSFSALVVAAMAASASAFAPTATKSTSTALKAEERLWNSMVDKTQRSKAVPYLPRPINLDGTLPGDQGFDPFYLSSIPKNFAGFIQPPSWEETKGIPTLYWMREAEAKHGRMAMLAVVGWIVADSIRLPFSQFSFDAIPNSYNAHNILVEQGTMVVFLHALGLVEVCNGAALVQVSKGESDREAADFGFDGGYLKGKTEAQIFKLKTQEINNGRLAMLAFGGIATQTALGHPDFPYF
ncbi:light-harvesting complex I chlorophyll a/b binding protein 2 [Fistulifera solaris]|nr:light-harvesting complex I chlorophyll a/b binding protein 2 [Fistulifera solaris]|eukprot:GAX25838.1 light-harvesting complex I chlorophyll a/b binding protein 2 [Fistulifera solaris]